MVASVFFDAQKLQPGPVLMVVFQSPMGMDMLRLARFAGA